MRNRYLAHHLAQQAQQAQMQQQHHQNNVHAAYADANNYQVNIPDRGTFQAQQQMQPFEFSPQYRSHDLAQSGQLTMTGQHQSQPAAAAQHGQLGQQSNQQFGQMMGVGQNDYTQQQQHSNPQFGQIGQDEQVGVNERGLVVYKPQGINTAKIVGNTQAYALKHFQTPPEFAPMVPQPHQTAPQVQKSYGYQCGGFDPSPQPQTQTQAVHAHQGQDQELAQAQGYNQFGTQAHGLFYDARGQRPAVRLPSFAKTPGKINTGASKATNKPVEKAKGTMINGLFYPEGQSPAEKAAAAKKKNSFAKKGMFVASPKSLCSISNSLSHIIHDLT